MKQVAKIDVTVILLTFLIIRKMVLSSFTEKAVVLPVEATLKEQMCCSSIAIAILPNTKYAGDSTLII